MILIGDCRSSHVKKWYGALLTIDKNAELLSDFSNVRELGGFPSIVAQIVAYIKLTSAVFVRVISSSNTFHIHYVSRYCLVSLLIPSRRLYSYPYGSDVELAPYRNALVKKLVQYNLRRSKLITVSSLALKRSVVRLAIEREIFVVPFGIPKMDIISTKNKGKAKSEVRREIKIGCFKYCRFNVYGLDRLLSLLHELKKHRSWQFKLYLINAGPDLPQLKEKIVALSLQDSVVFLVAVSPREAMLEYIDEVDFTVYLSRRESFGVSVLESMARGVPPIITPVGGMLELVKSEHNGLVVTDVSVAANWLLTLAKDADKYQSIGNAAIETVHRAFVWEDNFTRFKNKYNQLELCG